MKDVPESKASRILSGINEFIWWFCGIVCVIVILGIVWQLVAVLICLFMIVVAWSLVRAACGHLWYQIKKVFSNGTL